MSITEIKNNFHTLIDNLNDAEILNNFYEALLSYSNNSLRNELSEEGKRELLLAYEESEDEENLIDYQTVKKKHLKWISKQNEQ